MVDFRYLKARLLLNYLILKIWLFCVIFIEKYTDEDSSIYDIQADYLIAKMIQFVQKYKT